MSLTRSGRSTVIPGVSWKRQWPSAQRQKVTNSEPLSERNTAYGCSSFRVQLTLHVCVFGTQSVPGGACVLEERCASLEEELRKVLEDLSKEEALTLTLTLALTLMGGSLQRRSQSARARECDGAARIKSEDISLSAWVKADKECGQPVGGEKHGGWAQR